MGTEAALADELAQAIAPVHPSIFPPLRPPILQPAAEPAVDHSMSPPAPPRHAIVLCKDDNIRHVVPEVDDELQEAVWFTWGGIDGGGCK